jgi:hypothetical protein
MPWIVERCGGLENENSRAKRLIKREGTERDEKGVRGADAPECNGKAARLLGLGCFVVGADFLASLLQNAGDFLRIEPVRG